MNTKLIKKIAVLLMVLFMTSCNDDIGKPSTVDRFEVVDRTYVYYIVYDKETLVMYAISAGSYNQGNITVLVDADGKPLLYKGGKK